MAFPPSFLNSLGNPVLEQQETSSALLPPAIPTPQHPPAFTLAHVADGWPAQCTVHTVSFRSSLLDI